jgi:PKD repeat protein
MKKLTQILTIFIIHLSGCGEDPVLSGIRADEIDISQGGSSVLFAGQPVSLRSSASFDVSDPRVDKWLFGDGNSSEEDSPLHTFAFPGRYKITMLSFDKRISTDTTVEIVPPPVSVGSDEINEIPSSVFLHPGNGYLIVYRVKSNAENQWYILKTDELIKPLKTYTLTGLSSSAAKTVGLNKDGNIMFIGENLWEVGKNGSILRTMALGYHDQSAYAETEDGYLVALLRHNDEILVKKFGATGILEAESTINLASQGYSVSTFSVTPEGRLLINLHLNSYENSSSRLVECDLNGSIAFDKEHPFTILKTIGLSSGYLLLTEVSQSYYLVKVDSNAEQEWYTHLTLTHSYSLAEKAMAVFEEEDALYVMFDSKRVVKLNLAGDKIWSKQYGPFSDIFQSAVKTNSGNFVIVGTQQSSPGIPHEGKIKNDVLILEIDQDGNYVPR